MKHKNTFGVHFVLRTSRANADGKYPVYARIVVNGTRSELAIKYRVFKSDWKIGKGEAKPKTPELKSFNNFLEQISGKIRRHYWELRLGDGPLTAARLKAEFLGIEQEAPISRSLLWVVNQHQCVMENILKSGTMKNYHTTESYLRLFLEHRYKVTDMQLYDLNYEFISGFESFIRSNALREKNPCTTNGTMKHLERLKKMVTWALKNEWIAKDPFSNFRLKFKRIQRDFLSETELASIERQSFKNPLLERVRNLFLFSCYTGLAYVDLMQLRPREISTGTDNMKWIKMTRAKTGTGITVPLYGLPQRY
jgi:Phage integrase SAM-like domain/Arm DNA-binding domain